MSVETTQRPALCQFHASLPHEITVRRRGSLPYGEPAIDRLAGQARPRLSQQSKGGIPGSEKQLEQPLALNGLFDLWWGEAVHAADVSGRVTAMWLRIRRW